MGLAIQDKGHDSELYKGGGEWWQSSPHLCTFLYPSRSGVLESKYRGYYTILNTKRLFE